MLLLAVLVTGATDEGGVRWAERASRVWPLVPACVALATAIVLAGPKMRGEARALEALGRGPFANASGAALGAAAVGLLAAPFVLIDGLLSVRAFFPTVHAAGPYVFEAGTFSNLATGWRIAADGTIGLPEPLATGLPVDLGGLLPPHARLAATLVTAIGSVAFALTIAQVSPARRVSVWGALLATAAATTICLQGAASGGVPVFMTPLPSTALLLGAAWAIVRLRWQATAR